MRGVETLLLAALVGLLGLGLWQDQKWLPDFGLYARSAVVATSIPKATTEQKPKLSTRAAHGRSRTAQDRELILAMGEQDNASNSIVVEVPVPGTPNVGNLTVGTTRSALRKQYGEPMLDVTARREGRLVERYYYMAGDGGRLTVATLHDGKVVAIEALPY
jgi:hypothetical protein